MGARQPAWGLSGQWASRGPPGLLSHWLGCLPPVPVPGRGARRRRAPAARGARRFQLRCLLGQPLTVAAGGLVTGELRLTAHKRQSYDVRIGASRCPLPRSCRAARRRRCGRPRPAPRPAAVPCTTASVWRVLELVG